MSNNIDENMRKIIEEWGIPDILELKEKNLKFIFDSSEINSDKLIYQGLLCRETTAKFCLYDIDNDEGVFVMDFLTCGIRDFGVHNTKPYLKLMIMNVMNSKYRKKGIATYYLEKLRDYAIKQNIKVMKVHPNPNDEAFKSQSKKNRLEKDKLKKFYESKSLPNLQVEII